MPDQASTWTAWYQTPSLRVSRTQTQQGRTIGRVNDTTDGPMTPAAQDSRSW